MENKLIVSSSPHLNCKPSTQSIMLDVIIALTPSMIASVIIFGFSSALVIVTCIVSCVLCEYICRKVMKREQTISDLSCVVTGILLALNLPSNIHPLISVFGSIVAIVVVKQMFGGIGQNFVNPALTARIILLNSFPARMTDFPGISLNGIADAMTAASTDAVTTATPLVQYANGGTVNSYLSLFLGTTGGSLGETCALAIVIGGLYLIIRGVISPIIPVVYLGTAAVFSMLFGRDPLFDLLSGGLMLGAVFMATDYTTSPMYWKGKIVFAIGCGALTMIIREFGSLHEGVSYAIVIMNILNPLIERYIKPKAFGKAPKRKERAKNEA